jgi:hypothetical protein
MYGTGQNNDNGEEEVQEIDLKDRLEIRDVRLEKI